ncbi:MAG: c-type cytochrome [Burkholderiales bacterium]
MSAHKFLMVSLVAASFALLPSAPYAQGMEGRAAEGARKNSACAGCHGIEGWRTAYPKVYSVPKIGGQHASYIVAALKAYKSGARSHPTMDAIAASLSEQDMADLAAYYSTAAGAQQNAGK